LQFELLTKFISNCDKMLPKTGEVGSLYANPNLPVTLANKLTGRIVMRKKPS